MDIDGSYDCDDMLYCHSPCNVKIWSLQKLKYEQSPPPTLSRNM